MDHNLTSVEEIFMRTFEVENQSLRADVLTATTTLRQYIDAEMGLKFLLQDVVKDELMSMCICNTTFFTAFVAYVMILTGVIV